MFRGCFSKMRIRWRAVDVLGVSSLARYHAVMENRKMLLIRYLLDNRLAKRPEIQLQGAQKEGLKLAALGRLSSSAP